MTTVNKHFLLHALLVSQTQGTNQETHFWCIYGVCCQCWEDFTLFVVIFKMDKIPHFSRKYLRFKLHSKKVRNFFQVCSLEMMDSEYKILSIEITQDHLCCCHPENKHCHGKTNQTQILSLHILALLDTSKVRQLLFGKRN